MLSPRDMLPGALGLKWGMSKLDCLQRPGPRACDRAPWHVAVQGAGPDGLLEVHLRFTEAGLLMRMQAAVHMSRGFWDEPCETLEELQAM